MNTSEVLSLEHIDFLRDGNYILQDINLNVSAGEHWVILGPNGAGKSSLLNIIGAITHPSHGDAFILGFKLGRVNIRELREHIGHVNHSHNIMGHLDVNDVVATGVTGTTDFLLNWIPDKNVLKRSSELIKMFGLSSVRDQLFSTLSDGEQTRTLIARSLISTPDILLLDEPMAGLDIGARELFLTTLDTLHDTRPDLTTVMVTHHVEEIPVSTTHAMLIANGNVLEYGHIDDVLTSEKVSQCFSHPISIEFDKGRYSARSND